MTKFTGQMRITLKMIFKFVSLVGKSPDENEGKYQFLNGVK